MIWGSSFGILPRGCPCTGRATTASDHSNEVIRFPLRLHENRDTLSLPAALFPRGPYFAVSQHKHLTDTERDA